MIVNLNVGCKVYLNDIGRALWNELVNQIPDDVSEEVIQTLRDRVKLDGSFEGEFWEIMSIFGPYCSKNSSPFTTGTLTLEKNPNFKARIEGENGF